MLPLDPLTASALLIMAANGGYECKIPKPAQINVVPKTEEVKYDYSKTVAELQQQSMTTINPYSYSTQSHTNGFMMAEIALKSPQVKLDYSPVGTSGFYCLWYDEINLELNVDPTIVISKEVGQDRCMNKAVREHELKHVMVDRKIVNKYARSMGQKILSGLKQRGFIAGPIHADHVQATAARMRQTVSQILELEYKKMEIERQESQQAVDNLEEYTSISAACPDFNASR